MVAIAYTFSMISSIASKSVMTPMDARVAAARRRPLLSLDSEANCRAAPVTRRIAKTKRYSQPHALPILCLCRRKDVGAREGA